MLRDVEIGDWIFTIATGWSKVYNETDGLIFTSSITYKRDGRRSESDVCPSAWDYNPFNNNDRPPCEFEVGEVIAVRDRAEGDAWRYDKFLSVRNEEYVYSCDKKNWKYAKKLTPEEDDKDEY